MDDPEMSDIIDFIDDQMAKAEQMIEKGTNPLWWEGYLKASWNIKEYVEED